MIWKFLLAACECFRRYMNIIGEEYGRSSDEYLAAWEVWYGMKKGYDLARIIEEVTNGEIKRTVLIKY